MKNWFNWHTVAALQGFSVPRVHGNGFIQLDLDEDHRLHVWGDKRIPRQLVSSPIHDHVFGFRSEVVVGRLVNCVYRADWVGKNGRFHRYQAQPNPDNSHDCKLARIPDAKANVLNPLYVQSKSAGEFYVMEPFTFHETFAPEPTVTIMKKHGKTLAQNPTGRRPTVLVPVGKEPSNEFNRGDFDPEFLWTIIEENFHGKGQW
jgi:hypothetical protein